MRPRQPGPSPPRVHPGRRPPPGLFDRARDRVQVTLRMNTEPQLFLIDGHSLTFRAYYAIRRLSSPSGEPTGAVFGFTQMLFKLIDGHRPAHLAVVFDTGKPTFRSELYADYKANREKPPEDFDRQMARIYELLRGMGLAVYESEGYEADDVIATMAARVSAGGGRVRVMTADKDLFQLVEDRVRVLRPAGSAALVEHDADAVEASIGVRPEQVPDWLALVGDSSDNIPGVPGIGAKTATDLLRQFGSLEAMLERPDDLPRPRQREALKAHAEQARLSRKLATVRRDVPLEWALEDCRVPAQLIPPPVAALMKQLGFDSILESRGIAPPAELPAEPVGPTVMPAGPAVAQPAAESIPIDYTTLRDPDGLRDWVEAARGAEWLALDTETTDTDAIRARLVGLSLCHEPGRAIYIPVGHRPEVAEGPQLEIEQVRGLLAPLLEAGDGPQLSGHHCKYDWKVLKRHGFSIRWPAFDTMLAAYLLDPDKIGAGVGLKELAAELCGVEMMPIRELIGSGKSMITMAEVSVERVSEYAARDADVTLRLTRALSRALSDAPALERLMREVERPLIPVLTEMELGGFAVDVGVLRGLGERFQKQLGELSRLIWGEAGRSFNINSRNQVAQILYEERGLTPGRKTRSGYSVDERELERLSGQDRLAKLILDYRSFQKLQSTYIDALPTLVVPQTGRIHTSFNQTKAATGRLSSNDPNLQNIPIRTEIGRSIRQAFVADNPDHLLLKADYSQIELRILAHMSQDEALLTAYREDRDIHRQTAAQVFACEPEQVDSEMRAQAKTINFGIIYGMSAHGLAQQLAIPREGARRFIERYFGTYPGVRRWIESTLEQARERGYVETLMGRRRPVPDLTSRNGNLRSAAERIAINSPIQGTSADMIKLAMIRVAQGLGAVCEEARLVCQVHDELVFSVPRAALEPTGGFIRDAMAGALPLSVPVEVDVSSGPNWAEC